MLAPNRYSAFFHTWCRKSWEVGRENNKIETVGTRVIQRLNFRTDMRSGRHHIPEEVLLAPFRQKRQRNEPAVAQAGFGISSGRSLMPASASAVKSQQKAAAISAKNDRRLRKMRAAIQEQSKKVHQIQELHANKRLDRLSAVRALPPKAEFKSRAAADQQRRPADRAWDTRRYGNQGTALWDSAHLRTWYSAGAAISLASAGELPGGQGGGKEANCTAPASRANSAAGSASRRLQQYAWAPAFTWAEHAGSELPSAPHETGYCSQAATTTQHRSALAGVQSAMHKPGGGLSQPVRVPQSPLRDSGASLLSPTHPQQLSKAATRKWQEAQKAVQRVPPAGAHRNAEVLQQHWSQWQGT